MRTDCLSTQELNEIEQKLVGADEAREIEICDEHSLSRDDAYELMDGRGYQWDDRWVKRQPAKQ